MTYKRLVQMSLLGIITVASAQGLAASVISSYQAIPASGAMFPDMSATAGYGQINDMLASKGKEIRTWTDNTYFVTDIKTKQPAAVPAGITYPMYFLSFPDVGSQKGCTTGLEINFASDGAKPSFKIVAPSHEVGNLPPACHSGTVTGVGSVNGNTYVVKLTYKAS